MRIAYVLSTFPNLSETFVLNQIAGLIEMGCDVRIHAFTINKGKTHDLVDGYDMLGRTRVWPRSVKTLVAPQPRRVPGLLFAAARPFRALSGLADEHYNAIVCHFGLNGLRGAMLRELGLLSGPLITIFHGYDVSQIPLRHGNDVYAPLFARGDLFLPISSFWADALVSLGCPAERVAVHRMGIDLRRFSYRDPAPRLNIHFVSVSRLVEKKGLRYSVEAAARLRARRPDLPFRYTIAGDGPLAPELHELVRANGLEDRVHLPGPLSQTDVVRLLSDADAFLAPSVTAADGDMEGIPVSLMEAMAMGLPVISTFHSGIPELIEDSVSGLLVPERDAGTLAEAMATLIGRPELRLSLTRAAREKVEHFHDVDQLNRAFLRTLQAAGQTGRATRTTPLQRTDDAEAA